MSDDLIIYILGAGCSVCGSYPLAAKVPAGMSEFAQKLGEDAKELRAFCQRTIERMRKNNATTVDELVKHLFPGDRSAILEAKIATSAYFLSLENDGVQLAYPSYKALFEELLDFGGSPSLQSRLKNTRCRVLTYNYDRLYERTFIDWVRSAVPNYADPDKTIHKLLGTGLDDVHEFRPTLDAFCLLKLHGGIGQSTRDKDHGLRYPYFPKFHEAIPAITDANFHARKGFEKDEPLMMFPVEKEDIDSQSNPSLNNWSLPRYNDLVWKTATLLCEKAIEIRIVGYSMQFTDRIHFKEKLIRPAKKCQKITIQNLPTEKRLLTRILERMRTELEAKWEIEFDDISFTVDGC